MLTYDEQKKIERLATRDEEIRNMIASIKSDYHLTVSQISHEIRNPLTYINSSVQWIQKMHPEVEEFEFWEQIKNDLQYMRLLLDDISTFNNGDQLNICQDRPEGFCLRSQRHPSGGTVEPPYSADSENRRYLSCFLWRSRPSETGSPESSEERHGIHHRPWENHIENLRPRQTADDCSQR